MLSDEQIRLYLEDLENKLMNAEDKIAVELTTSWVERFPSVPVVYVVFEKGYLVYVGETGNIRGRMRDLQDSRHHVLRRNIGRTNLSGLKGYQNATSKKKFPEHIEEKIDEWLRTKMEVSLLTVRLGRKELEETIFEKYGPKYNRKGRRLSS